jgi:hypothetical protein
MDVIREQVLVFARKFYFPDFEHIRQNKFDHVVVILDYLLDQTHDIHSEIRGSRLGRAACGLRPGCCDCALSALPIRIFLQHFQIKLNLRVPLGVDTNPIEFAAQAGIQCSDSNVRRSCIREGAHHGVERFLWLSVVGLFLLDSGFLLAIAAG